MKYRICAPFRDCKTGKLQERGEYTPHSQEQAQRLLKAGCLVPLKARPSARTKSKAAAQ